MTTPLSRRRDADRYDAGGGWSTLSPATVYRKVAGARARGESPVQVFPSFFSFLQRRACHGIYVHLIAFGFSNMEIRYYDISRRVTLQICIYRHHDS